MSGDIHVKLDDSWFERWQKCGTFFGQRSAVLRLVVKKVIVELENQRPLEKFLEPEKKD